MKQTRYIFGMIPWMFWTLVGVTVFALIGPELVAIARGADEIPTGGAAASLQIANPPSYQGAFVTAQSGNAIATIPASNMNRIVYSNGLTIDGFKYAIPAEVTRATGIFTLYQTELQKAEKPDEVLVILTTKDGRRWRAKWVEDISP